MLPTRWPWKLAWSAAVPDYRGEGRLVPTAASQPAGLLIGGSHRLFGAVASPSAEDRVTGEAVGVRGDVGHLTARRADRGL